MQNDNHRFVAWVDEKFKHGREMAQTRVSLAQDFKAKEEARQDWAASRRKARGQWLLSLITSGAVPGWNSLLQDSADGVHLSLNNENVLPPGNRDGIGITETELEQLFEEGKPLVHGIPGPPLYRLPADNNDTSTFDLDTPPPEQPVLWSYTPDRPYFLAQQIWAEHITLSNGKSGTKVILKNLFTDGEIEEKVIIQEPGKVLEEVEKARALIEDRIFGFDQIDTPEMPLDFRMP